MENENIIEEREMQSYTMELYKVQIVSSLAIDIILPKVRSIYCCDIL